VGGREAAAAQRQLAHYSRVLEEGASGGRLLNSATYGRRRTYGWVRGVAWRDAG
jgi:hypothetical protein